MKKLTRYLLIVLAAILAGYAAWCFIPCQPERSYPVPSGTELLEFSPAGSYAVTFQRDNRRLSLWRSDNGTEAYAGEIPYLIPSNVSTNGVRGFYGFSSDDRLLAAVIGSPEECQLVIVDLASSNATTTVAAHPSFRPQPAFSSDGRYLDYLIYSEQAKECAVLYDIARRHEQLRVPGAYSSLGPPTRQGKWFFQGKKGIECWDVVQKQRDDQFPLWTQNLGMMSTSLSPDEQYVNGLCFDEARVLPPPPLVSASTVGLMGSPLGQGPFLAASALIPGRTLLPHERIFFYRCDLARRRMENAWEYGLPPSAHLFWNGAASDPETYLLIKTLDDQGNLVQDLLDVNSGKVLARYPQPISMLEEVSYSYQGQTLPAGMGAGLIHTLGRTGEIGIDSERRVLVSKQVNRDPILWRHFGKQLSWLGIKQGPPALFLQFHSAETGKLLECVSLHTPYTAFRCVLAVHPSQPLLAVIDEQATGSQLQFWHLPPPKPWGWIIGCAVAGGGFVALLRIGFFSLRRRGQPAVTAGTALSSP